MQKRSTCSLYLCASIDISYQNLRQTSVEVVELITRIDYCFRSASKTETTVWLMTNLDVILVLCYLVELRQDKELRKWSTHELQYLNKRAVRTSSDSAGIDIERDQALSSTAQMTHSFRIKLEITLPRTKTCNNPLRIRRNNRMPEPTIINIGWLFDGTRRAFVNSRGILSVKIPCRCSLSVDV